ncbi:Ivy family c-type lysozyme inhibitor [Escherichia coli]|nr:Ivy family c-type lysozyme inhibitor [Escherichia coli]
MELVGIVCRTDGPDCSPGNRQNGGRSQELSVRKQYLPISFRPVQTDPAYKKSFDETMNQNGLPAMLDEMNGPAGPMEPVKIDGKVYLKGFMCEDGNCGNHNLTFLYQPDLHNFVGFYSNGKDGQWVNTPSDGELKVLRALVNGTAEPAHTPIATTTSNDAPPANTIWEFTGVTVTLCGTCAAVNITVV